ncbi:SPI-6 associated protein [Salmonella enterica subsp. enterica]|nr:SPI-6 associated protein [Salmonella enterica subsp. enterica]
MKSPVWATPAQVFGAGQRGAYRPGRTGYAVQIPANYRPLTLEDYLRFLPGGNNLPVLTELVRTFIGFEYCWEIEAAVEASCRTACGDRRRAAAWLDGLGR